MKKKIKKSEKTGLTHINGLVCQVVEKTKDGLILYVDTNSNYWIYDSETGSIIKK